MVKRKLNDTESYYNRGIAYYEKREYDKAIADFSEVIKRENVNASQIERLVRRWFVMSVLTERYSGEPQATLSEDVRNMSAEDGVEVYRESLERSGLSDAFWDEEFLQKLNASGSKNVYFNVFLASQIKANDKGFLSRDLTIQNLFEGQKDIHHVFPKKHLSGLGVAKNQHNQLANLVAAQKEINIAIGNTAPATYFSELQAGCRNGEPPYGGINNSDELQANLDSHCIPEGVFEDYDEFLKERRKLIATKIREYYFSL